MPVYKPSKLVYAAHARCSCGAGLAYGHGMQHWDCSRVLIGTAPKGSHHDDPRPFVFWKILPEGQPSAKGATTRPKKED